MKPLLTVAMVAALAGCDPGGRCGPTRGIVAAVIDGDTIELTSGERVRYLMIDAPELSGGAECYGPEARQLNSDLVLGQEIALRYDVECEDRYERLLAYVSVGDREINSVLVERGYACVLHVPPNGDTRLDDFEALETQAEREERGLWGACQESPPC